MNQIKSLSAAFSGGGTAKNRKKPCRESREPVEPQECCVWPRKFESVARNELVRCHDAAATFPLPTRPVSCAAQHHQGDSAVLLVQFLGYMVAQLAEVLCYKLKGRGFDSRWVHWHFSLTHFLHLLYSTMVDSASNRDEYHGCLLAVKVASVQCWQPCDLQMSYV